MRFPTNSKIIYKNIWTPGWKKSQSYLSSKYLLSKSICWILSRIRCVSTFKNFQKRINFWIFWTILKTHVQSFAKDWRILIVLKTWKMRQSLACQSLACQFLHFSEIFWSKNFFSWFWEFSENASIFGASIFSERLYLDVRIDEWQQEK